jgi:hypothetical protein
MHTNRLFSSGIVASCLVGATLVACGGGDSDAERAGQTVDGAASERSQPGETGGGSQSSEQSTGGDQSLTQSQSSPGSSQSSTQSGSGGDSQSSTQSQSCTGGDCSSSSRTSGASSVKTFSGTGRQTISFNVEEPSTLSFTPPTGPRFTLRGDGIAIDEAGGEGRVDVEAGDYQDVRVDGERWTIVVRPR